MKSNGGIALGEQLYAFNLDLVAFPLEEEHDRLAIAKQVFCERLFVPAIPSQGKTCSQCYGTFRRQISTTEFHGDGCQGQNVVVVIDGLVPQDRLTACSANIVLAADLEGVLQRVGFVGIRCHTGWKRKMPRLDGVVPVVDSHDHGFKSFLAFAFISVFFLSAPSHLIWPDLRWGPGLPDSIQDTGCGLLPAYRLHPMC